MTPTRNDDLRTAWRDLVSSFGAAEVDATFADLVGRYAAPDRFYHDLTHLREVLGTIEVLTGPAASAWDSGDSPVDAAGSVRLAAWYHDAVYDSRAEDNEERSAALARDALARLGVPAAAVGRVAELILLTKTHEAAPGDAGAAVLLDADLGILGAPPPRYDEYARAIRREYAWVPDEAYREGRRRVLERFLGRARVYRTGRMFDAHERQARENMRREIDKLLSPRPY